MNFNFVCIASRINLDVPHQIWEAQASDPISETVLTRFFHNKLFFYLDNYLRCYLSYFSVDFLTATFTLLGALLFLLGFYFLITRRRTRLLILALIAPIFPLFEIGPVIVRIIIIFAALLSVMMYAVICSAGVIRKWQGKS